MKINLQSLSNWINGINRFHRHHYLRETYWAGMMHSSSLDYMFSRRGTAATTNGHMKFRYSIWHYKVYVE